MFNENLDKYMLNLKKLYYAKLEKNKEKIIFHVDVNSAFLSWTAVKLLKEGYPLDIRKILSVIGGDQTKRKGVVLAKSDKAKAAGIKTGEPIYFAMQKAPSLKLFKPDYSWYEKCSKNMQDILKKYSYYVEQISVDESFLDVTDFLFNNTPLELAKKIQLDIYNSLGFTVNIGIANSRVLAKTASDFEKPNKIHTLFNKEIPEKLWPLDISKLYTLGSKTQDKLRSKNIKTIKDLATARYSYIFNLLGSNGKKLWEYANGMDDSIILPVDYIEKPKSFSCGETFAKNITDTNLIHTKLLELTDKVCKRLRKENFESNVFKVVLRNSDFKDFSKSEKIKIPTSSTNIIYDRTKKLADSLLKNKQDLYSIRYLSVEVSNITEANEKQNNLFELFERKKENIYLTNTKNILVSENIKNETLDKTIDKLNAKFGKDIIKRGSLMKKETSDN